MSRQPAVDYLRVYPGLNDFSDALETIPLEVVRHFTLLKEIDAKCTDTGPQLDRSLDEFSRMAPGTAGREDKLQQLCKLLEDIMPCLEEKMHVTSMAADAMNRFIDRVEADYKLIVENEIPENIQVDYNDSALMEIKPPEPQTAASRAEARREATAARKAAAAEARSRASTPQTAQSSSNQAAAKPSRGRGRTSTPQPTPQPNPQGPPYQQAATIERRPPQGPQPKRRRNDDDASDSDMRPPGPLPSRRRRMPAEKDEPVYCYCEQVSYPGMMVGCDGAECKREWFHLSCVGLSAPPTGQWFCEDCRKTNAVQDSTKGARVA